MLAADQDCFLPTPPQLITNPGTGSGKPTSATKISTQKCLDFSTIKKASGDVDGAVGRRLSAILEFLCENSTWVTRQLQYCVSLSSAESFLAIVLESSVT
jgi:hypothetical protein